MSLSSAIPHKPLTVPRASSALLAAQTSLLIHIIFNELNFAPKMFIIANHIGAKGSETMSGVIIKMCRRQ